MNDSAPSESAARPGEAVIQLDVALTVVFALTAVFAAVSFSTFAQWVGAITALVLFFVGVAAFAWSFWNAVQRSRTDEIGVAQLYLLIGDPIPAGVRRVMNGALTVQVLVAIATTFARPNGPDGSPGSSLALGFLVPMLGFGLNGVWAAYHGDFPPRSHDPAGPIGQTTDHG
ncbi:MAG: hypothetical protein MUE78_04595 [Ilumatobacteraceae bacterium]|nr:hypothetical protein [Ilumatobacteraceae bacterium]